MTNEFTGTSKERNEKLKTKRDRLAGYLYTMSQVTFGTMVLAVLPSLLDTEVGASSAILFAVGLLVTFLFAIFANRILTY